MLSLTNISTRESHLWVPANILRGSPLDRAKTTLTELIQQTRSADTPIVVERIVDDIDDIVRKIRFPEWQATNAGEREVRKALRRTLFKYKLHTDTELFEKAYGYVKEYY